MSPAGQRLWSSIAAARRRTRRDGALAAGAAAGAAVPAALVLAWALGTARAWLAPSPIPLAIVVATVAAAVAVVVWALRRWVAVVDDMTVAAAAEQFRGMPPGSVRGVLELSRALPAGTSPALYMRAEALLAQQLAGATPRELSGPVGELARRRRQRTFLAFSGLASLTVLLGYVSPERSRAGWGALLHPVAHLSPPPLPALVVEPGDVELPRGAHLDVAIEAPGRTEVMLRWRAEGDVPRQRRLAVAEGRATSRIAGVDAEMVYWVVAPDGAASDTFRVTPLDPLLFSDLVVDVVYPAYLEREPERFEGEVPPLTVPAGTELRIRGRATRRLREASLLRDDGESRVPFEVTADRFAGRWTPRASGRYVWSLTDETGAVPLTAPAALELTVVPDRAPEVQITFPGPDTLLGPDLRQPVVADARDDYGLHSATLVSWRVSRLGGRDEPVEQSLTLAGDPARAILRAVLDANERRMLPGDELHYFVRVVDASPARQVGVSATHVLRLPGMEELRRLAETQSEELIEDATALARSAERLDEATRSLARQSARSARGGSAGNSARAGGSAARSGGGQGGQSGGRDEVGYEQREQVRQIVERQEEMIDRVERMREQTEALERALEAAGLQDPELQRRLAELRQLYDQILTPELRQKLEAIRDSLGAMDAEQLQRALEQLAQQQQELRQQVDQSLELLRRAALEQQMNDAVREARELAAQQQALAEQMKREGAPTPERAAQQRELTERVDSLQQQIAALQQRLRQQGEASTAEQAGQAGEQLEAAQQAMRRAAQQAQQGQGQQAAESGGAAAEQLEQVADALESAREAMAEAWRDEVQQSVDQAANDALELARRQAELLQQMQQLQRDGQQGQSMAQPSSGQSGQQSGADPQPPRSGQSGQTGAQGQQSGQQGSSGQQGQQGQAGQQGQSGQQGRQGEGRQGQGEEGWGRRQGGAPGAGGQRSGDRPGPGGSSELQRLRSEQAALQQGLEALGRNLAEAGRRSAMVNQDVGSALGRAMLSMQQTLEALEGRDGRQRMPVEEAQATVEALNRLALELLENGEQIEQAQTGTGLQQALEQLAELARQQGSLNGQANSLLPLDLGPRALAEQMQRMAREQHELAKKLGGLNDMVGGQDDVLGRLDELAREAEAIARELSGGRLTPELLARQERLFHRLLDAGRTLEREEYTSQRVAERPGRVEVSRAAPLDAELLHAGPRYPVPDAEALRALPPAYRRLILEYFDRLNRAVEPAAGTAGASGQNQDR
ncbi:MAG TPA: hypothetical protein VF158_11970 [Longimicrobiales bacterium]